MIPLKIIQELSKSDKVEVVLSKKYKGIPISKNNFKPIQGKNNSQIYAIDGGSAIIADGGAWIISKLKVGIIGYNEKSKNYQKVKNYYCTIINRKKYEITLTDEKDNIIQMELPDFSEYEIDEVPSKVMKILEWQTCKELCNNQDQFILMDSSLEGDNDVEQEIINKVSNTNNIIVGFCKTSRMRTINGRSLLGVINSISEKQTSWQYYPLYEDEVKTNTYIVKLHKLAKYCHKVQLFKKEKNVTNIFQILAYFASDSEVLGYPYPLLKVDKVARINSFEKRTESNAVERELKKTTLIHDTISQSFHAQLDKRMYK